MNPKGLRAATNMVHSDRYLAWDIVVFAEAGNSLPSIFIWRTHTFSGELDTRGTSAPSMPQMWTSPMFLFSGNMIFAASLTLLGILFSPNFRC